MSPAALHACARALHNLASFGKCRVPRLSAARAEDGSLNCLCKRASRSHARAECEGAGAVARRYNSRASLGRSRNAASASLRIFAAARCASRGLEYFLSLPNARGVNFGGLLPLPLFSVRGWMSAGVERKSAGVERRGFGPRMLGRGASNAVDRRRASRRAHGRRRRRA